MLADEHDDAVCEDKLTSREADKVLRGPCASLTKVGKRYVPGIVGGGHAVTRVCHTARQCPEKLQEFAKKTKIKKLDVLCKKNAITFPTLLSSLISMQIEHTVRPF